ncbi:MAG: BrnT family toxin [Rhodomicrobium sp.]
MPNHPSDAPESVNHATNTCARNFWVRLLDDAHGSDEERWVTIGLSRAINLMVVVHTYVEFDEHRVYIRIISARRPTRNEKRQYEEAPGQG